jgi:hypothetical protein
VQRRPSKSCNAEEIRDMFSALYHAERVESGFVPVAVAVAVAVDLAVERKCILAYYRDTNNHVYGIQCNMQCNK